MPEYFNANGISLIKRDLLEKPFYVVLSGNNVIGFAVLTKKSSEIMEISWMAVKKDKQGRGAGSSLLDRIVHDCRSCGIKLLEVKTLSESVKYLPYEATRKFYRKNGFIALEIGIRYPGWDEDNLCDVYVKLI